MGENLCELVEILQFCIIYISQELIFTDTFLSNLMWELNFANLPNFGIWNLILVGYPVSLLSVSFPGKCIKGEPVSGVSTLSDQK